MYMDINENTWEGQRTVVLGWTALHVDSETKALVRLVYLGGDSREHWESK